MHLVAQSHMLAAGRALQSPASSFLLESLQMQPWLNLCLRLEMSILVHTVRTIHIM